MATSLPTAETGPKHLRDRAEYLPLEAQALRRCIAELYNEVIALFRKANREQRRKSRQTPADKNSDIWELIGLYPDDICGYAQRAEMRVPVKYPAEATEDLRRASVFELPGVLDWLLTDGREMPATRQYLETVDYLRLQVIDYIQRFDHLTVDQKSF